MGGISEPIFGRLGVQLADTPGEVSTFEVGGAIDKLDVTIAAGGDVLLQFKPLNTGQWTPSAGLPLRAGNAFSFPGLAGPGGVFDPPATAFRLWRATVGVAAAVDVIAWLVPVERPS